MAFTCMNSLPCVLRFWMALIIQFDFPICWNRAVFTDFEFKKRMNLLEVNCK